MAERLRLLCVDSQVGLQAYVRNVKELLSTKELQFDDPLNQMITVANFYLAMFGKNDVDTYKQLAQIFINSCQGGSSPASLTYVAQHVRAYDKAPPASRKGRQIKVGFISMFFRDHASGKMIQGIIKNLPRDKVRVTVFAIHEPGQHAPYKGTVADRIRDSADRCASYLLLPGCAHSLCS